MLIFLLLLGYSFIYKDLNTKLIIDDIMTLT